MTAPSSLRVLFIGSSAFGLRCLRELIRLSSVDIVGAVTNPRQFSISYSKKPITNVNFADLKALCEIHEIPVYVMTENMREPGLTGFVRAAVPDLMVVVGWYHMVPRALRDITPAVGLHASLLPDYSGGAPLVWAIINGETETGITLFQFDDGVDNGPILGQASTPILECDTIATLYARIEELGLELLREYLPKISDGSAVYRRQDEARRRIFPQRNPDDGQIDWRWSAHQIYNFVRAQTRPYPGAFGLLNDERVIIWACVPLENPDGRCAPGQILARTQDDLRVACGAGGMIAVSDALWRGCSMDDREVWNGINADAFVQFR